MQTMSITRALAELKRTDDRIARQTSESRFIDVLVGKNTNQKVHESQLTVQAVKEKIQSNFDTLNALFKQRDAIKAAIVKSNAVTMLQVGNRSVTVAEAIEMKRSITNKKQLALTMKNQYVRAQNVMNSLNAKLEETIELNLKTIYGSDKSKVDATSFDTIAKPQRENKEASLLDPMKIAEAIQALEEEVSLVDTELDYLLSESNAKTMIEF